MWKKAFSDFSGLLLIPCNQIHTFFMKMRIDVIFIDKYDVIVYLISNADTGKVFPKNKRAYKILEVESGTIKKYSLKSGDKLEIKIENEEVYHG